MNTSLYALGPGSRKGHLQSLQYSGKKDMNTTVRGRVKCVQQKFDLHLSESSCELRVKLLNRTGTRRGPFSTPIKSHLQTGPVSQLTSMRTVIQPALSLVVLSTPSGHHGAPLSLCLFQQLVTQEAVHLHGLSRLKPQRGGGDSDFFCIHQKRGRSLKLKL